MQVGVVYAEPIGGQVFKRQVLVGARPELSDQLIDQVALRSS
jgi:hypothetical protein